MRAGSPFHAARMMAAAVAAALAIPSVADRMARLQGIGPYRSRGKGGKKGGVGARRSVFYRPAHNSKQPQGERECARRRYQLRNFLLDESATDRWLAAKGFASKFTNGRAV